jgi:predicted transcriptional regulator of viral defense system
MNISVVETHAMLQNLAFHGMIDRLERGKYCRYNFRNDKVIGSFISGGGVISYWSAMHLHNMTEQIPNVTIIQLPRLKHDCVIFGVRYHFVHVYQSRIYGITSGGYGNEIFPVTDKEKTLIDCFDQPGNTPGFDALVKAFVTSDPDPVKLLDYGRKIENISILKRMAFLSELFSMKGFGKFRSEIKKLVSDRYSPFYPNGSFHGPFIREYKIRLNLGEEQIRSMVL